MHQSGACSPCHGEQLVAAVGAKGVQVPGHGPTAMRCQLPKCHTLPAVPISLQIVRLIDNEAVPLLRRCSLAGHAELKTRSKLFTQQPLAADMLIDILSGEGHHLLALQKPHKLAQAAVYPFLAASERNI